MKKKKTDNAVEIIHRRYVKDDPKKIAELEKIRANILFINEDETWEQMHKRLQLKLISKYEEQGYNKYESIDLAYGTLHLMIEEELI